ncbi:hypothetical protein [Geoglobus acetivorans]|uniref:Transposase n=1 Tax=Geoglobus acetivorans TaxID=565033 RepID=A0ABZ3H3Z0_GEOAI|nr:hypothetical protein [Geoglobus acetivorans]
MPEVLYIRKGTGRPRKDFPLDLCLSLRAKGYSYEMIAWKLRQMGYDVSKWTVMRRLRIHEKGRDL